MRFELDITVKIGEGASSIHGIPLLDTHVPMLGAEINDRHRALHRLILEGQNPDVPLHLNGTPQRGFVHPSAGVFHFTSRVEGVDPF